MALIAYPPPFVVGCRRLAIRFRPAVVALWAHAVLALALARGRRRRVQATAAQRISRGGGEGTSLCPCSRRGRYPPRSGRGGGVRRVP